MLLFLTVGKLELLLTTHQYVVARIPREI